MMKILGWLVLIGLVPLAISALPDIVDMVIGEHKPKQHTFVYCPMCRNELVSSRSFIEDKAGIVKYKCDKCGNVSFWDFAHYPVPYLRTCASDCEYFAIEDTYYGCTRKGTCDPDSMVEFKQRWWKVKC